jgi:predicted nucleotide-binding protein
MIFENLIWFVVESAEQIALATMFELNMNWQFETLLIVNCYDGKTIMKLELGFKF